jgi:hypothetical protein
MADTQQHFDLFDLFKKDDLKEFKFALSRNKKLANCSLIKSENIMINDEIYETKEYSNMTILEFCIVERQPKIFSKNRLHMIDVLLKNGAFSENVNFEKIINLVYGGSYFNDSQMLAYTRIIKNIFNNEKWLSKAKEEYTNRDIGELTRNYNFLPEFLQSMKYTVMIIKKYFLYLHRKKLEPKFWEIVVLPKQKLGETFCENQKEELLKYLEIYFRDNPKFHEVIDRIYDVMN